MGDVIRFPDPPPRLAAILIDRDEGGSFTVEPYRAPHAADQRIRTFTHAGDALDYAERLGTSAGAGVCVMCDL